MCPVKMKRFILLALTLISLVLFLTSNFLLTGLPTKALLNVNEITTTTSVKLKHLFRRLPTALLPKTKTKFKILFWTEWYKKEVEQELSFWVDDCADDFIVTSNRSELSSADAIIFILLDMPWLEGLSSYQLPQPRDPDVPWIVAITEAPNWYPDIHPDFDMLEFNWTWSDFMLDSDFPPVANSFYSRMEIPDESWVYGTEFANEFLRKKTKQVAWVVSNCVTISQRSELTKALASLGVAVDIYGECGPHSCPDEENCFEALGANYKFYLAFENSLCRDYITEKVHHGLDYGMIPITYGLGNYSYRLPKGSWIDVLDFHSLSELADLIRNLTVKSKKYFEYFAWRQIYSVQQRLSQAPSTNSCRLWRNIRNRTKLITEKGQDKHRKVYKSFRRFYSHFLNSTLGKHCPRCVDHPLEAGLEPKSIRDKVFKNFEECID